MCEKGARKKENNILWMPSSSFVLVYVIKFHIMSEYSALEITQVNCNFKILPRKESETVADRITASNKMASEICVQRGGENEGCCQ